MAHTPCHPHSEAVIAQLNKAEFELKHRDDLAKANFYASCAIVLGLAQLECTLHNLEAAILEAFQGPPEH